MSLLLAELSDRVDGSAPGAELVLDLTIIPGVATGTQKQVRIASGGVLGQVNRRDGFAPGAILNLNLSIIPGQARVTYTTTIHSDDELLVWLLNNPKYSQNEALVLWEALRDDDD
jgi:hypothetical protein